MVLPEYRQIHFPTEGAVSFSDDFGDPRSGGRSHEGNDLMGQKMQKLLAAVDGRVTYTRVDAGGLSGNMLTIVDEEGWSYRYIHVNNDTPGTDDGANPIDAIFAPGIVSGVRVKAGQHVAFLGDSGNAEGTSPHLHFEIRRPDGSALNPWTSLRLAQGLPAGTRCSYGTNPKGSPSGKSAAGYWVLGADGGVFSFGAAKFHGSTGAIKLNKPIVGMAATPTGEGYWLVASDGGIFAFGDAAFFGSLPGIGISGTVVSMASTKSGEGYWLLADDGGVFSFGDAGFKGSLPGIGLCKWPTGVKLVRTLSGNGYWVQGNDGSTWAFGDAKGFGGVDELGLPGHAPTIDLVPVPAP